MVFLLSSLFSIGDEGRGLLLIMATRTFGTLKEFDPDAESIKTYLDRVELYFTANSVVAAKQVPILLSAIGSSTYTLLSDLLASYAPKEKSLAEITAALRKGGCLFTQSHADHVIYRPTLGRKVDH